MIAWRSAMEVDKPREAIIRKNKRPTKFAIPSGIYLSAIGMVVNTRPKPPLLISEMGTPVFSDRNPMNMKMGKPQVTLASALAAVMTVAL